MADTLKHGVEEQNEQFLVERPATKLVKEIQDQAERTDFPQSGQKCPESDGERESPHPGMAGLLRDSEHEDDDETMGRVDAAETSSLYLEIMKAPESENTKPNEVGHTEVLCPQMGVY